MPNQKPTIIDINSENVDHLGFFCRMSKMKTVGNKNKLSWLHKRFSEGLKIKMLELPARGFIEYIPGEYAWRSIDAKGYMFIHCLWVVGKSKGKGFGEILLNECIKDAKNLKLNGVAVLTSNDNFLANQKLFLKNGFEISARCEPAFELLVKKFKEVEDPKFISNYEMNQKKYKDGITVFLSDQCPYLDDAANIIREYAEEKEISFKIIELKSSEEVRKKSPSPNGTFNIVYNGELLSYYYILPNDIEKAISKIS